MARDRRGDIEIAHEREGDDLDQRWDPSLAGSIGANSASADAEEAAGSALAHAERSDRLSEFLCGHGDCCRS